jgi:DNA-binding SARP family transcriptional activator/tetratricopeptide (TPR) repeat protein
MSPNPPPPEVNAERESKERTLGALVPHTVRSAVSRLRIGLFSSPWFTFDAAPWAFSAPPGCLALLALLALRREPMSRQMIAATLWPDEPDAQARSNLRRHVHRLSRALPQIGVEWIRDEAGRLSWNHDEAPIDVAGFVSGIGDAERMAEAADLYAGELLERFEHEWLVVERERLRMLYLDALRDLCGAARKRRDFPAAIRYAERLLSHDDLREDALRELIAARYEEGDRSVALATYERFAMRLRESLDVEPMAETIALRDAIAAGLPLPDASGSAFAAAAFARDLRQTPFVGRRGELDTLQRAWMRAARGFGSTMLIAGDAGMGKSRLLAEFSLLVEQQGGRVVVGSTAQPEGAPYQALIAAAQRGLTALGRDGFDDVWAAALTDVLPEIRAIRPEIAVAEPLDADRSRTRLHEALARYFDTIARGRPLVLVLEDLHWAGRDTIDAVEGLARRGAGAPLLIVATFRPDDLEESSGMRALARRLRSEQRAVRTTLGPLRPDEIGDLVARTPVFDHAPSELSTAVARLSEGNPLFVWQLLRSYEETQRIPDVAGAALSVSDAIMTRADRLGPDVRSIADAAATIGGVFTVELVAAASGRSEAFVQDALEELLERHLVYAASADGETYAFAHALIASAIYAATPSDARLLRHRRIARQLERTAAADRVLLGDQARHWDLAGDRERAHAAYVRAAEAALAVFARDEAASYARRAAALASGDAQSYGALSIALLAAERGPDVEGRKADLERLDEIVPRLGDAERFSVLEGWMRYHAHVGDSERQAQCVEALVAIAETSRDQHRRVAAIEARSYLLATAGQVAEAEGPLVEAVALASAMRDDALHARLALRLGHIQARLGKSAAALVTLQSRRAALTPSSSPADWLDLLSVELNCAFVLEEMEMGARAGAEQLALARRVGDVDAEGRAHGALSYVAHWRGDAAGMREHSDLALAAFERIGNSRALGVTVANRGTLEFELGRIDEALHFWERAGSISARAGARDGVAVAALNRAEAELVRERFDAAAALGANALEAARGTGEERHIAEGLVVLGAAKCALGESTAGLRDLREGIARWRAVGGSRSLPHELSYLVEALVRAGDLGAAAKAAEELVALDISTARFPARIHLVLGAFHDAAGDAPAARRHFEEGRRLLRARLAGLDPADANAYRAFPFSRALLRPGGPAAAAGLR